MAAQVIACASSDEKRAHCLDHGADHAIDYPAKNWRDQVKRVVGGGVDIVYDPVGGDLAEPALRFLNPGGRYLVVGFVAGIARIALNLPLLKRCSLHGVNWGASVMADPSVVAPVVGTLANWVLTGKIDARPTRVHEMADAGKAFAALFKRRSTGSIVVRP